MRIPMPNLKARRTVDTLFTRFFHSYRQSDFHRAMSALSRFYRMRRPRVDWYEYLDWGKSAGRTYETGQIHLVHPENWKNGRKYHSERRWINTVYHEFGHYLLWADPERKADMFAWRFVRGVSADRHSGGVRLAASGSRARRKRVTRRRSRG